MSLPFPSEGLVYDYRLDDGGISRMGKSDDDEEDVKKSFKVPVHKATSIQLTSLCMDIVSLLCVTYII